jgi:hypothetical protein
MLMLLGALLVVQLSAEAMDGADEVRSDVRWKNVLSFAINAYSFAHTHYYLSSSFIRTVNTVAPNFGGCYSSTTDGAHHQDPLLW